MKNRILTLLSAAVISVMPALSHAGDGHNHTQAEAAAKPQSKCPILGGAINKEVFVDYKGKRIYFCCPGCDKKFLAKADELMAKAEAEGVQFEAAPAADHADHGKHAEAADTGHAAHGEHHAAATEQTICPVSDEPIDKAVFVMHDGQKIYFCCKMCRGKFKNAPDDYLKKVTDTPATHAAPAAPAAGHGDHSNHNH